MRRALGSKRARQAFRWLRSRVTGGVLILGYHRVSDAPDPYGLCVQPRHFEQHLAVLRRNANIIPLTKLVDTLQRRSLPPRSAVITFDDGYFDNVQFARPLLEQAQAPATLFVATGYLGEPFWWDEVARLVLHAVDAPMVLTLEIKNQIHTWRVAETKGRQDVETVRDKRELLNRIYQCLLHLDISTRASALAQLRQWASLQPVPDQTNDVRAMTPAELRQMAEGDLVTIGAHTVTHPVLARLTAAEQRNEILQSRQCLTEIVGLPVTTFSYPNGSGSVVTRTLVCQEGFALACASFNDVARPGSDLLCLPRFWVPDWDGEKFARWLHRWLPA